MSDKIGWLILSAGLLICAVGGLIIVIGKVPGLGNLPGDIYIERENFSFYFPFTTSLLFSLVLSLIFLFLHILK